MDENESSSISMTRENEALKKRLAEAEAELASLRDAREHEERRFQTLGEYVSDVILIVGPEMEIHYASPSMVTVLGYDPSELIGTDGLSYVHPDDARKAHEVFASIAAPGAVTPKTLLRVAAKDGSWRVIEFIAKNALDEPAVDGVILCARDVTERRAAEDALRRSEEEYRNLVDNLNDGIWAVDADGRTTFVNPRTCEMLGYTERELLGEPLCEFVPDEYRAQAIRGLRDCRRGAAARQELRFMRKDGALVHTLAERSSFADEDGERRGCIISLTDITAQRQAEEERERIREQLVQAQKMEAVGRLAGGIAHDFNNLLTVLIGHSDIALDGIPADSPVRQHVVQIREVAARAVDLAGQLLVFSRKHELSVEPCDANAIVEGVVKMLARVLGEDIAIELELADEETVITGDRSSIEQMLVNLAVNARDAMPHGGTLTLRTESVSISEQQIPSGNPDARPGRYVRMSMKDTGSGIDAETAKHVFEPFYTTKEEGEGTGLGLAVVFGVTQRHGGWVELESEPGMGATFHIYIPATETAIEPSAHERTSEPCRRGSGERILVVEDETAVREFIAKVLTDHGYEVVTARSVGQAVAACKEEPGSFDLIMSDIVLPDGHGTELGDVLDVMRENTPMLLTSGYVDRKLVLRTISRGDVPFLKKPYSVSTLLNTIAEVLERSWTPAR